ncbi:hypothetical protein BO70DRAFT_392668 [Aspergillus heteromorphus CBS 117.55]|uniref:Uncharacterized protein n=1 Tax=Aspergillus heteromorphus CBS 117.55 TaxID=1448321 RepID=A0A317WYJ1_9EURO|nr:uncharacterized protein BO70DRAFT_392668 [Aspergillus heteromorphus CBS 117.55]PWY91001.1 hypothetical protein BO70DRAFT_392668 [Aspergillus heteromorphus CBS 117.55]
MFFVFFVRSMQNLAIEVPESTVMNILDRVYKPEQQKNKVLSLISAVVSMRFVIVTFQGGVFNSRLQWAFASTTILCQHTNSSLGRSDKGLIHGVPPTGDRAPMPLAPSVYSSSFPFTLWSAECLSQ